MSDAFILEALRTPIGKRRGAFSNIRPDDLVAQSRDKGERFKALLDDPSAAWSRPALTTYKRNNHAVRSERWRYIRYSDGSEELYDHSKDPNEWTNLAATPGNAEVIRKHARWLPKLNVPNAATGLPPKRQKKKKQR